MAGRLVVLPFALLLLLLRFLLSFRLVRRSLYTGAVLLLLLAVEAALLRIAWGSARRTLFEASLIVAYGASLAALVVAWRRYERRCRLRVRRFESLLALTPAQFEHEVGRLLRDLGYRDVVRVGSSGDLGVDLRCRDKKGDLVVVQCKRYAPGRRVGSGDVQAFIGMMAVHHQAQHGIFVTTAHFTAPAAALAQQHGVRLLDGPLLSRLVQDVAAGTLAKAISSRG